MSDGSITMVVVTVAPGEVELASEILWGVGAPAIEERAGDAGTVELWTALGDDAAVVGGALQDLPWAWRFESLDPAVTETWRAFATPTVVDDRVVVLPAWVPDPGGPEDIRLVIEPGPTFGLGNHPTTVLCLRALRAALHTGDGVLDVGTGSGVLAIAAVRLGASNALGVDIMPACLDVVPANAALNGVAHHVTVTLAPLTALADPFDVVVANILAPAIVGLAPDLVRLTTRTLIVSGLLADRTGEVLAALGALSVASVHTLDGWTAITLVR